MNLNGPHISITNKDKFVLVHSVYNKNGTDFELGFYEAIDFFQYITCYFNILVANEIWPPKTEYDKERTYEILDDRKLVVWNHYWEKFESELHSPSKFYARLDFNNKNLLYMWYKTNVNKDD